MYDGVVFMSLTKYEVRQNIRYNKYKVYICQGKI